MNTLRYALRFLLRARTYSIKKGVPLNSNLC